MKKYRYCITYRNKNSGELESMVLPACNSTNALFRFKCLFGMNAISVRYILPKKDKKLIAEA